MNRTMKTAVVSVALLGVLHSACDDDPEPKGDTTTGERAEASTDAPTWHQDIAPLVATKCSGCHKEGGIAPFSLEAYASAKPFATQMAVAVEAGTMPPFLAQDTDECQPKHAWKNDLRLSASEKKQLRDWADANAPEGDPKSAAPITPPASVELEREDVIMQLPSEVVIDGDKDLHLCVIVDPQLSKDEYAIGSLITSGNPKVLHHVVSYLIDPGQIEENGARRKRTKAELEAALKKEKGVGIGGMYECFGGPALGTLTTQMLDAWAPGGLPNMAPADAGQPLAKDSLVLLDVHYHPTGDTERDSKTKLSLMLAKNKPAYVARTILIGNFEGKMSRMDATGGGGEGELLLQPDEDKPEFVIPPNANAHVEDMTWTWSLPLGSIRVLAMGTHMHYVGRKMRISVEHAAPTADEDKEECLIETPAWDFNWQRGYSYDAPYEALPELRNGDVMKFHCEFDNSMDNRFVRQALADRHLSSPVEVRLGEDTLDEMCLGAIGIMYPNVL